MQNSFFDVVMPFITHYGNWYLVIGIFVCFVLFKDYRKALAVIALTALALIFSDAVNSHILKPLFSRVRPCNDLPDVRVMTGCTGSFSFPSSHASNIFAISAVLVYEYRKIAVLMLIIAAAVSYSRVYLGVHYPSDVIAGGILGSLYGIGIIRLKKLDLFENIFRYER